MGLKPSRDIGALLSALHRLGNAFLNRRLAALGVGAGLHAYLLVLAALDRPSQDELSGILLVDKANTTRALGKLEDMGLVSRSCDPEDARRNRVSLTGAGRGMIPELKSAVRQWGSGIMSDLDEAERKTLLKLLPRLVLQAERLTARGI